MQNYPNPFNPVTSIQFILPEDAEIKLSIYNQLGVKVAVLLDDKFAAGVHQINFDASNLSSGVYFFELISGGNRLVKKLTLMK